MSEFREKYLNPFTDFGFKKLFGEELLSYEDSLKYYRDLKNSLDLAKEEGKIEGELAGEYKKAVDVVKNGHAEGLSIPTLSRLTGLSEAEISAILRQD